MLGVHGAGYGNPPEIRDHERPGVEYPAFYFRRVEQLRAIQERYGTEQADLAPGVRLDD